MSDWFMSAVEREYIKSFEYDSFENKILIGEGGFGTVYSAYSKDIDQTIALKKLHHCSINDDSFREFVREIKNNTKVDHNINIIRFFGITKDPTTETYHMVLQYANNGDLRSYLRDHFSELDWPIKIKMAKEISSGINCLHNANIIHRDLHDKNILRENPSDIYSLGVLFWELSSGVLPFINVSDRVNITFDVISGKREAPINGTPIDFMNLYCNAWNGDPNSRPKITEICHKLNSIQMTPNGQNWEPYFYAFDLNEGKQIEILQKQLEIQCCIILTNQKYKEMSWIETKKYSIYKSLKWEDCGIKGDIQKIFFSMLYEGNIWKNDKDCYHVFANVSPKRFIMRSFGDQEAKGFTLITRSFKVQKKIENHISYFIMPF
ncbi:kinase-like protein [Gigaspora margarita]|uniref:Kinase-like protein n=1 Tax=Gigaspora margarita TaxID=4874 RepID=A0A8H3X4V5_GIGMA|nr:kinase-like protein [Gigaspora margarita]